jgi:hypothetical protein
MYTASLSYKIILRIGVVYVILITNNSKYGLYYRRRLKLNLGSVYKLLFLA